MEFFDYRRDWAILLQSCASGGPAAAAADLKEGIGLLRERSGLERGDLPIMDADGAAPPAERPIIVLGTSKGEPEDNGYSWRCGAERIEVYGSSDLGLRLGIYSLIAAMGIDFDNRGVCRLGGTLPANLGVEAALQPLSRRNEHRPATPSAERRRVVLPRRCSPKLAAELLRRAARLGYDTVVIPPERLFGRRGRQAAQARPSAARPSAARRPLLAAAVSWSFSVEEGGRLLSPLIPRRLFLGHRDLFRMEGGRRSSGGNFCPTNPATLAVLRKNAQRHFLSHPGRALRHLWPEGGASWCSCPSCRAFSPDEQAIMALNALAQTLEKVEPGGKLSCPVPTGESSIRPKENLLPLRTEDLWFPGDQT